MIDYKIPIHCIDELPEPHVNHTYNVLYRFLIVQINHEFIKKLFLNSIKYGGAIFRM